jgi:hypothetical protein
MSLMVSDVREVLSDCDVLDDLMSVTFSVYTTYYNISGLVIAHYRSAIHISS